MPSNLTILSGYLILFLLYQIAEANGQDILHIPPKPLSIAILFLLVIGAAALVARWQGADGLAAYGMGFHPFWWRQYLQGLLLGMLVQGLLELLGLALGMRKVTAVRFSLAGLAGSFLWILFANFPAAAAEDLLTRGYPFRFMQASPLLLFVAFSTFLYVINHIIRLITKPISDWYFLPFAGITLAYALARSSSLWLVIGLHQSGNVSYYLLQNTMKTENSANMRVRMVYGIVSELVLFLIVVLVLR